MKTLACPEKQSDPVKWLWTHLLLVSCGCFVAIGIMSGCSDTRNSFGDALRQCETDGYIVIERGKSDLSGYAILGNGKPPHSTLAFAVFAVCHDKFSLAPDKDMGIWASVGIYEYDLKGNALAFRGINKLASGGTAISAKWQLKWEAYLRAKNLVLSQEEKAKADAFGKAALEIMDR